MADDLVARHPRLVAAARNMLGNVTHPQRNEDGVLYHECGICYSTWLMPGPECHGPYCAAWELRAALAEEPEKEASHGDA